MEFNKKGFEAFSKDLELAVKALEAKYEVEISVGRIKYSPISFTMDLKVEKTDLDTSVEQVEFETYCKHYGFSKEDYKIQFNYDGKTFELFGFNPKSPKNSCAIKDVATNKIYHCPKEMVMMSIRK